MQGLGGVLDDYTHGQMNRWVPGGGWKDTSVISAVVTMTMRCRWVESMQGNVPSWKHTWCRRRWEGWVGVRESNRGKGNEWMWEWRMIGGQENVSDAKRVRNQKTQCRKKWWKMIKMRMRETMRWAESLWNPDWNKSIEEYKTCKLSEKLGEVVREEN